MTQTQTQPQSRPRPTSPALIALSWLTVALPLAWGVWETLVKVAQLFQ